MSETSNELNPATSESFPPSEEAPQQKLRQTVEITDVGPCRKFIKVVIDREDVEARLNDHYRKLVKDSYVPGFRPGKAPRRLVEKQFEKDVSAQVSSEMLMASLQQLGEDYQLSPLSPPNIDPDKIVIPRDGPLVYAFDIEVRPQFDLPEYRNLKLKRQLRTFKDVDVEREYKRVLRPYGQVVPKSGGQAESGDVVIADVDIRDGSQVLQHLPEMSFRMAEQLGFQDAVALRFEEQMKGAKAGESRTVELEVASVASVPHLRGQKIEAVFHVKDIKTVRMPDVTPELFESVFGEGVREEGVAREMIRAALERMLNYQQRQSARRQVTAHIAAASSWELPQDLVLRQAQRIQNQRVLEMRADGVPEAEIQRTLRMGQQDIMQETILALREHFVLQKIAEVEKIEITDEDINDELERLADRTNDTARRLRARFDREGQMEALVAEMTERQVLDLILGSATYEEEVFDKQLPDMEMLELQALPGKLTTASELAAELPAPDVQSTQVS